MNNISINPLVTVVIPTYNHAKYLRRALSSVFNQSYQNLEVVVVDNFSTDDTQAVLDSFGESRLKILRIHNEGCIAKSRNIGLLHARGEWIAFLDSDDYWCLDKIERCILVSTNIDVIYHRMYCYRDCSSDLIAISGKLDCRNIAANPLRDLVINGPALTTSAIVVRKSMLDNAGGFDENSDLIGGEDFDLWVRLAKNRCRFKMLDEYLAYYLVGGSHITSAKKAEKILSCLAVKHFPGPMSSKPNWVHKSMLASYIKLHSYREFCKYIIAMWKKLSLKNMSIVFFLAFKTLIMKFIFNVKTIN
jgi:glycosyltransferase involved in cell wall biosynthesis